MAVNVCDEEEEQNCVASLNILPLVQSKNVIDFNIVKLCNSVLQPPRLPIVQHPRLSLLPLRITSVSPVEKRDFLNLMFLGLECKTRYEI